MASRIVLLSLLGALLLGCSGGEPGSVGGDGEATSIQLALTTRGWAGTTYRLSPASFLIQQDGSTNPAQVVDASKDEVVTNVPVEPGNYTVTLSDGWVLNEVRADGSFQPVPATLMDSATQHVNVGWNKTKPVSYMFMPDRSQLALGIVVDNYHPGQEDGHIFPTGLANGGFRIDFYGGTTACCFSSEEEARAAYPGLKLGSYSSY